MYLERRTWKGSWFSEQPGVAIRSFHFPAKELGKTFVEAVDYWPEAAASTAPFSPRLAIQPQSPLDTTATL